MDNQAINLMVTESLPPALKAQTEYTAARVQHYVNRGYYDFVKRTKCIEDIIDITTVADKAYYVAADSANLAYVYHVSMVRYITSGSTDVGYKLKPYPGGFRMLPRVKSNARPTHYWTQFANVDNDLRIGTWPINSATGDTLRVYAYMFPTALLVNNGDQPIIKLAYRDALAYYAIARLYNIFSHINGGWKNQHDHYMGLYLEQVESYKYYMAGDSADELPTLYPGESDIEDW